MSDLNKLTADIVHGLAGAVLQTVAASLTQHREQAEDAAFDARLSRQRAFEQRLASCTNDEQRRAVAGRMEALGLTVAAEQLALLGPALAGKTNNTIPGRGRRNALPVSAGPDTSSNGHAAE